jgi:hypothetical protein
VFFAILDTYAKQNHLQKEEVLSHIFDEFSKPVEVQKLKNLAR